MAVIAFQAGPRKMGRERSIIDEFSYPDRPILRPALQYHTSDFAGSQSSSSDSEI